VRIVTVAYGADADAESLRLISHTGQGALVSPCCECDPLVAVSGGTWRLGGGRRTIRRCRARWNDRLNRSGGPRLVEWVKRRSSLPARRLRQRVDHQVRLPYGSYQFRVCGFGVRAPPPLSADDRDHVGQRPRRQRVPERSGGLTHRMLHDTFSKLIAPGQGSKASCSSSTPTAIYRRSPHSRDAGAMLHQPTRPPAWRRWPVPCGSGAATSRPLSTPCSWPMTGRRCRR
jgi:hypothetical protein